MKILISLSSSHYASDVDFREYWKSRGVENSTVILRDHIRPQDIRIAKNMRGQGLGTMFMSDLCDYADHLKMQVRLMPSKDFGATSVSRLIKFYKRFGFVQNSGRTRDFGFRESMYRNPK